MTWGCQESIARFKENMQVELAHARKTVHQISANLIEKAKATVARAFAPLQTVSALA